MRLNPSAWVFLVLCSALCFGTGPAGAQESLIAPYETGTKEFRQQTIGDKIVFFHQRMLGEAIVEKDFVVYQFNKDSKELVKKIEFWRKDLLNYRLPVISQEQAETSAKGDVKFSALYIISPESDVFPLTPVPKNPCWIVAGIDHGQAVVSIIDAVSGDFLAYGVPPPYTAFSFSGPIYWNPCDQTWSSWYLNAQDWFDTMGYHTEALQWPTRAQVQNHIQSTETAMFYAIAHGGSTGFCSGCSNGDTCEAVTASDIESWIAAYTKVPFSFIGSCGAMCSIADNTFSYELRKGSAVNTATVGYCDMAEDHCYDCWVNSLSWQAALFSYMNAGWTVKAAYDQALADYPQCTPANHAPCMRFAGDTTFKVVPVVERIDLCRGDFDGDADVDGSDMAIFAADFGRTDCDSGPVCEGNFDGDTDVDGSDLAVFSADFGRTDCP